MDENEVLSLKYLFNLQAFIKSLFWNLYVMLIGATYCNLLYIHVYLEILL